MSVVQEATRSRAVRRGKETLGYPSRTLAIAALRAQGKSTVEIAIATDLTTANVAALEASARRAHGGAPLTERTSQPRRIYDTLAFPKDLVAALRPHAAKREISVSALAKRIVTTVLEENMIDAVLDDAEELKDLA